MLKLETKKRPSRGVLQPIVATLVPALLFGLDVALLASSGEAGTSTMIAVWVIRATTTLGALVLILQFHGAPSEDRRQILPLLGWIILLAGLGWSLGDPVWIWFVLVLKTFVILAWVWAALENLVAALPTSKIFVGRKPFIERSKQRLKYRFAVSTPT